MVGLTSAVLRALSTIVDVVPDLNSPGALPPRSTSAAWSRRQALCRFLLAIYMLDILGWVCYKIVQFEAVLQVQVASAVDRSTPGDSSFMSPVLFVTVLTTLETTIEIVTSSMVPRMYSLIERSRSMHPGRLAIFVMKVYTASAFGALIVAVSLGTCIVSGARDALGQRYEECTATTCRCGGAAGGGNTSALCDWTWDNASAAGAAQVDACCLLRGDEVDLCPVPGASSCPFTPGSLATVLSVCYCVLYCFLNQLGDAGREMAMTQWLGAFEGTVLVFPGFASSRSWPMRRPASSQALSTHLLLLRYFVQGIAGVVYLGVRSRPSLRLLVLTVFALMALISGLIVLCGRGASRAADGAAEALTLPQILRTEWPAPTSAQQREAGSACQSELSSASEREASIGNAGTLRAGSGVAVEAAKAAATVDEAGEGEGEEDLVLWPWQLHRWELSLTLFMVATRGLPQTSSDTLLAYFSTPHMAERTIGQAFGGGGATEVVRLLLSPIAAALWLLSLVVLCRKAYRLPRSHVEHGGTPTSVSAGGSAAGGGGGASRTSAAKGVFGGWLCRLHVLVLIQCVSGILLAFPSWLPDGQVSAAAQGVFALVALVAYVPYIPISKLLEVHVDAFLIEYDDRRSPSLVYWNNILLALVVWPLLLLKWVVVSADSGQSGGGGGGGAAIAPTLACGAGDEAEAQRESYELGLVVVVTSALLVLAALYYSLVDPLVGAHASVRRNLDRIARESRDGKAPRGDVQMSMAEAQEASDDALPQGISGVI